MRGCFSSLSDLATCRILSDDAFVQHLTNMSGLRLAESYIMAAKFPDGHRIPYKKSSNAGLFIWVVVFAPIPTHISVALIKQRQPGIAPKKVLETIHLNPVRLSNAARGSPRPGTAQ